MKYFLALLFLSFSNLTFSDSIGLGMVAGIKQYDFASKKQINIYLDASATETDPNCIEKGRAYGKITHSKHDEATIGRMFSIATAAYVSGKKIRLHSEGNVCEIDFVAFQESVF